MKTRMILSAFAALAILSSCSSDSIQNEQPLAQDGDARIPIMLSVGSEDTRASQGLQNTQFKKGETLDVQITSADNLTSYDQLTYFAADNAGKLQPLRGVYPYYPTNGANVDIRAIYPTGNMGATTFSVTKVNQSSSEAYMASDLMFAKVTDVEPSTSAVLLTFQHKMAKICVNLTGEGGVDLSNSTVKILGVKTETAFNPQTGEVTIGGATGTASDIKMTNDGSQGCAAIIVPQTKSSGYLLEIVLQNNDVLYYQTVQDITFEPGKVYTFNITVIESNITVGTTVEPWASSTYIENRLKL